MLKRLGCAVVVFFIAVVATIGIAFRQEKKQPTDAMETATPSAPVAPNPLDPRPPKYMAEQLLRKQLKFPDDSEPVDRFQWEVGYDKDSLPGKILWIVKGKYRAANALGARLVYPFEVYLFNERDDFWVPVYIQLGDEKFVDARRGFLKQPANR